MNCLEFRRICLAEPGNQGNDYLRHQQECPRCAEHVASVIRDDKQIEEALRVDVPDNLASRIILRQSIFSGRAERRRARLMYALAAGVLLAAMITGIGSVSRVDSWKTFSTESPRPSSASMPL